MTQRIVWLMGVAAVATMVILAGCGDGPGAKPADPDPPEEQPTDPDPEPTDPDPTPDYVAALAGTWTATVDTMQPGDPTDPTSPLVDVQWGITATIAAGDMANTGTLELVLVPTIVVTMQQGDTYTVTGTIAVDTSAITVTITGFEPLSGAPPELAQMLGAPQEATYAVSEDGSMLTVGSALFPVLLGPTFTEITLTREMASS